NSITPASSLPPKGGDGPLRRLNTFRRRRINRHLFVLLWWQRPQIRHQRRGIGATVLKKLDGVLVGLNLAGAIEGEPLQRDGLHLLRSLFRHGSAGNLHFDLSQFTQRHASGWMT